MTIVGFIGGTGIEGKGLALRLAAAGASVTVGSRSEERAAATAAEYNALLGRALIRGAANANMLAASEIVFLTVRFDQALSAIASCRDAFRPGQILVDVTVPVRFEKGQGPSYIDQEGGVSGAEILAGHLPPGIPLVCAFKTLPARVLADLARPLDCDEFVCGDDEHASRKVTDLAKTVPGLRLLNAGPLKMARVLERMTMLAIQLNRMNRRDGARYRIVGI